MNRRKRFVTLPPSKPRWLRIRVPAGSSESQCIKKIKERSLCTVCVEAHCPNQLDCFSRNTATFMLLGPTCTRGCTFCAVGKAPVQPPDASEPTRIGQSVLQMKLKYCVLTMVTRDDLPDGGAQHLCRTVEAIRFLVPEIQLELLISDLEGRWDALEQVLALRPHVLNHNIETVPRLYPKVRPQAVYQRSLDLISRTHEAALITKSGIMLGLGETQREVLHVMDDLRAAGCQLLTMGQYLAPSHRHHPVRRYVPPEEFDDFKTEALRRGFKAVASAPLVRSSFRAEELYQTALRTYRSS